MYICLVSVIFLEEVKKMKIGFLLFINKYVIFFKRYNGFVKVLYCKGKIMNCIMCLY